MTSTLTRRPPSVRDDNAQMSSAEPLPPSLTTPADFEELLDAKKCEQPEPEPLTTKIYYYIDDQDVPYSVEVPVPPSRVSLTDFKSRIHGRLCKAYCKNFDDAIGREVKADILDEDAPLKPNADGRFELFLLTTSTGGMGPPSKSNRNSVRGLPEFTRAPAGGYARHRVSAPPPAAAYLDDSTSMDDSSYFGDSNMRILSDGDDSQSDFLSNISPQYGNDGPPLPPSLLPAGLRARYGAAVADGATRHRRRRQQKRQTRRAGGPPPAVVPLRRRSYSSSFLSTTFDDTELSMALNLLTVTIRLDAAAVRKRPFGMSVRAQQIAGNWHIVVYNVAEKSIVALDGRIKPGYTILYVNNVALEEFAPDQAIEFIKKELQQASLRGGHVTFTCSQGDEPVPHPTLLTRLPPEPVRPIDPQAWAEHCNAVNDLRRINEEMEQRMGCVSAASAPFPPLSASAWPAPPAVPPPAPQSSSAPTSNATVSGGAGEALAGGPSSGVGSSISSSGRKSPADAAKAFHAGMEPLALVCAMADPLSGLRLHAGATAGERAFLGCELLDWLARNVRGLDDDRARRDFASTLLKEGYILQAVTRKEFTQQCYYTFNEQLTSKLAGLNTIKRGALTLIQNPAAAHLNSSDELTFSTIAGGFEFDAAPAATTVADGPQPPTRRPPHGKKSAGGGGGFFRRALRKFFCFPTRAGKPAAGGLTPEYTPVRRQPKKAKRSAGAPAAARRESTHIP